MGDLEKVAEEFKSSLNERFGTSGFYALCSKTGSRFNQKLAPRVRVGYNGVDKATVGSVAFWPDEVTVMGWSATGLRVSFEYDDPLLFDRVVAELEAVCVEWKVAWKLGLADE
mgnify:CR=1 FL=1